MKTLIGVFLLCIFNTPLSAQDTVMVFVNNAKTATCIGTAENVDAILNLKKATLKNLKQFTIQVKSQWLSNTAYKKELELEMDTPIIIPVSDRNPGIFDIFKTTAKSALLSGKKIKLYLLLNPANKRMMMPSRRVYLGMMVAK